MHTVIVLNCKKLAGTRTTGNLNLKAGPEAPSPSLPLAGPLPVRHRYLGDDDDIHHCAVQSHIPGRLSHWKIPIPPPRSGLATQRVVSGWRSKIFPLGRLSCTLPPRCKLSLACVPALLSPFKTTRAKPGPASDQRRSRTILKMMDSSKKTRDTQDLSGWGREI